MFCFSRYKQNKSDMDKEAKLKNRIKTYGQRIGARQKKVNKLVNDYKMLRDDQVKMKASRKEINIELKSGKHSHDEFVKLNGQRMAISNEVSELSSALDYLNEAIGCAKREIKLLQQVQSSYIEKLKEYQNSINNIQLKTT